MQECDICGRKTEKEYVVEIEGATMHACERCSRGMSPIEVIDHSQERALLPAPSKSMHEDANEITDGYGDIIRKARERLGITNKELALRINEKESLIARIERNQLVPEPKVSKKLEKALGIKLESHEASEENPRGISRSKPLTLGDTAIRKESRG